MNTSWRAITGVVTFLALTGLSLGGLAVGGLALAGSRASVIPEATSMEGIAIETQPRVTPRAISSEEYQGARARGVAWLIGAQHRDGGWGSGEWGTDGASAPSDVATTAYAVLALYRDGRGVAAHRAEITRGVGFVLGAVEAAPAGPRLQTPTGTQIQYKLGELVDTHMAALMLGELAHQLDPATNTRISIALDTVIGKIQSAQRSDGSFDGNGWAPVLSSSVAAQALYRAAELGKDVDEEVFTRAENYQQNLATPSGTFDASAGAGVELYAVASTLRTNTSSTARKRGTGESTVADRAAAQAAADAIAGDGSGQIMAGFGSIGGEEMLSYMMISDTLVEQGGAEWTAWEGRVGAYLASIQNADGSWAGHHCITSRTFTTAGAIMTLAAGDGQAIRAARG